MEKIDPNRGVAIPVRMHPLFRTEIAIQNGVEKNLLFKTWGGLGDQICAEPTLRYALKNIKGCNVSLASERPELFKHLKFHEVFDLNLVRPNEANFLTFETITQPDNTNMVWLFFSHMLTNCVDFPSLCALRSQLPVADRRVVLEPSEPVSNPLKELKAETPLVCIHPGRHWPSKTFPREWWDAITLGLVENGIKPVIIGGDTDDNRGTVEIETNNCLDLRNKLSVNDSIWLLQRAKALITNDSAPLHMAVTGNAHVFYVATCKHPDYITHWRDSGSGEVSWGWRMKNLGLGGMWNITDHTPNQSQTVTVDQVDPLILKSWLPTTQSVVEEVCAIL